MFDKIIKFDTIAKQIRDFIEEAPEGLMHCPKESQFIAFWNKLSDYEKALVLSFGVLADFGFEVPEALVDSDIPQ